MLERPKGKKYFMEADKLNKSYFDCCLIRTQKSYISYCISVHNLLPAKKYKQLRLCSASH